MANIVLALLCLMGIMGISEIGTLPSVIQYGSVVHIAGTCNRPPYLEIGGK